VASITGLPSTLLKWRGGVLGPDGKIYGIPHNATSVLTIDPVTNTVDTTSINGLIGIDKWRGGVLAPNGKIYALPLDATCVLIIDPFSPISNITGVTPSTSFYTDGSLTLTCPGATFATVGPGQINVGDNILLTTNLGNFTGYVQTVSSNTTLIFVYALGTNIPVSEITAIQKTRKADVTSISGLPLSFTGNHGARLGRDGKIYTIPGEQNIVLVIDPNTNTFTTIPVGPLVPNLNWADGVLAPNGVIYGVPYNASQVLRIRTGLPVLTEWPLLPFFNKM
jgi:hypothetical protein